MLLVVIIGWFISDYMMEKFWQFMGVEFVGYWLFDGDEMEMVFGGMNVMVWDYVKIGEMFCLGGKLNGK